MPNFAKVMTVRVTASWPPLRNLFFFAALVVLGGCNRSTETAPPLKTDAQPVANAKGSPTIKADPNPVPAGPDKFGKTTVSWDTGDGKIGEVYVSPNGAEEKRFSGAKAKGSQEAAWIGKGEFEFRLYAGKEHTTVLATVKVSRSKE